MKLECNSKFAGSAVVGVVLFAIAACFSSPVLAGLAVIPIPREMTETTGQFDISKTTTIQFDAGADDVRATGEYLGALLAKPLGASPRLDPSTAKSSTAKSSTPAATTKNTIVLTKVNADSSLGEEGYELAVTPDSVVIRAPSSTGLFYGVQTLRQLLPPEIESNAKTFDILHVPCVAIKDSPRFHWRGLMLDVSRHFFDKQEIETFLDLMALHKMNVFHWHLVDDEGWRIEIKKYPKLTEVGAWRDGIGFKLDPKRSTHYREDGMYGGFYTQDDIREVVAHAARLHITVVPEIEMPGHSGAALRAYPEFSSAPGASRAGGANVFNPGREETYVFLQDVLTEVTGLFPSSYIHIGGDEVAKAAWKVNPDCQALMKAEGLKDENELQSYFIRRIDKFLKEMSQQQASHVLGPQGCLWAEVIPNLQQVELMTYPRACALAEVGWSDKSKINWDDFASRLTLHEARLKALGVNYYQGPLVDPEPASHPVPTQGNTH